MRFVTDLTGAASRRVLPSGLSFRLSLRLGLGLMLGLGGCPQLTSFISAHLDAGTAKETAEGTTSGPSAGATTETASSATGAEPLRDDRERRLKNVRQLTHGLVVASPRFTPDGKTILFLSRADQTITLERVSVSGGKPEPLKLPLPHGSLWSLVDGVGGTCAVLAPPTCSLEPWPEPRGLVPCTGLSEIPTAEGVTCPSQPEKALPCVQSVRRARACAMPTQHGAYIAFQAKGDSEAVQLGPHDGLAFAPAFSADGQHLLFVAESDGAMRLWDVPTAHPDLAAAVGPESQRMVDPVFTPSGDAALVASTIDDTGGQELDLDLLKLDSGALERVTFEPGVDRFPALSPDGKTLAWVSERNADPDTSDLFVATWVAEPGEAKGK